MIWLTVLGRGLHFCKVTVSETDIICYAIYHHGDKHVVDSPMDEVLKDADVIHHCMNDISKPVKEKEQAWFDKLYGEFGINKSTVVTK